MALAAGYVMVHHRLALVRDIFEGIFSCCMYSLVSTLYILLFYRRSK